MEWMLMPLRRYAEFSGRSRRKEYWMFTLFLIIVGVVVGMIEAATGMAQMIGGVYGPLSAILGLATLVPSLAVSVRRLHDTGRSGWWLLAVVAAYAVMGVGLAMASTAIIMVGTVIVLVAAITLFVFMVLNGTPGANQYGPDPKNSTNAEVFA